MSSSTEIVIKPNQSWIQIDWRSLFQYRDLFAQIVQREFTAKYKQTLLGPLWFLINPLITTMVFTIVFSRVGGLAPQGVPPTLFYMSGLLAWNYFANSLTANGNVLRANMHLFGKVYFPRLIVPLANTAANLLSAGIHCITFVILYVMLWLSTPDFHVRPQFTAFLLPLIFLQIAALAVGTGLILSSLSAKYRDFHHLSTFLVNIWMYMTPVIYPLTRIPEKWRWVAAANPMTPLVELTRSALLGTAAPEAWFLAVSAGVTFVVFITGVLLFQRTTRTFVDYA